MIRKLPDWAEVSQKDDRNEPCSAIERFVYDNEPAGREDSKAWREALAEALTEASAFNDDVWEDQS